VIFLTKLLQLYHKYGIKLVKGFMQYVWDDRGVKYLDLHTGYGTAFLGHSNPKIVDKIYEQMHKLMVASYSFDVDIRDECIKALSKILPKELEYVFFQNSGTEAVEAALKFSRKYTGRKTFVSFTKAFHGRTMGALSLTWNPKYRKPFEPLLKNVVFAEFNNVEVVDRVITDDVAAVVVEVIQGEGGLERATHDFLHAIRSRCDEVGCVVVFDEVQSGFGRTGKTWAHQHYNTKPDIITAGKAIGGGYPVSLVAVRREIGDSLEIGEHGTTYGGNPVACAAVLASINVLLEENVPEKAAKIGEYFAKRLKELISNREELKVKGLGLMLGLDVSEDPKPLIKELLRENVIALKAGESVLRFLPPYVITREDVDRIIKALEKVLVSFK